MMWQDMASHMNGYGWGWFGFGALHMGLFWLVVAVLVVGLAWLLTANRKGRGGAAEGAMEILERRYARGEIDRKEYQEKKAALFSERHR